MGAVLLIPILFPVIFGLMVRAINFKSTKRRNVFTAVVAIINSGILAALFFGRFGETLTMFEINDAVKIVLHIDGLSMVFGGLLAFLWPLATIYAFEYMEHEHNTTRFFTFYTITYGIAVGVAFSANLFTMYLFYELLTLITLPLVMHEMDKGSIHAGRQYIIYSIAGASFALMGVIMLLNVAGQCDFTLGGVLTPETFAGHEPQILVGFLACFFGFGVKAAIFPFQQWLPGAGVAPTPVTALLHAVAVVKAGVFAVIRVIFFAFGADYLRGTWAQYVVMAFAAFTIVLGSAMALRQTHLKRRLAYSTVSNLSYILFGATLMTDAGMSAALSHMIFHGIMKITLFCVAGTFICKYHNYYIDEIKGYGRKMPVTMACFTIASLGLMGIPFFCGFISKFNLISAAVGSGFDFSLVGVYALIASALMTSIYLFTVIIKAFFPGKDFDYSTIENVKDPTCRIKVPLIIICVAICFFGIWATPLTTFFNNVATGVL